MSLRQEALNDPLTQKLLAMGGTVSRIWAADEKQQKPSRRGGRNMAWEKKEKGDTEEVCGLWIQESKAGKKYFRGKTEDGTVYLIFRNENKKSDKAPDYRLMREVPAGAAAPAAKPAAKQDDDLPF